MNTQYTPEYFIKKFEAIPGELWITGAFVRGSEKRCCALGHCGARYGVLGTQIITDEAAALDNVFWSSLGLGVAEVNDGTDKTYTQATPKQRILAALRDIAEMEKK